jgi:phage gp29-like protein
MLLDEQNVAEGIDLAPFKFICHLPHLKTGIPIRGGIARVAAWAWMCKNYTVKDWLAFAEVFGMPLRVGKYQPGASKEDIAILKAAVANLGSDAAAVIPESMLIEFVESAKVTGGHELFNKLADWLDAQVSRGILGQTATTQGTAGKLGNEDAQAEVREDIRDDDAAQLSETINRDLVRPFIDLNWGPQQQYPELVIKAVEPEDTQLLVTALEKLVPLGLKVEQSVVRDKLGLPDPEEDAECLGAPPPAEEPAAVEPADEHPAQPEPVEAAQNSRQSDSLESALLQWVKAESAGPAASLITRAEALLEQAESLEQFREQLIDLLAESHPEQLGEIMARLDLFGNLAGRMEVAE